MITDQHSTTLQNISLIKRTKALLYSNAENLRFINVPQREEDFFYTENRPFLLLLLRKTRRAIETFWSKTIFTVRQCTSNYDLSITASINWLAKMHFAEKIYFKETRQLKSDLVGYGCHILTFPFTILCTCIFTGSKIGVITFWGFLADDMCKKLSCRYLGGGSTFYTFAKISFLLRSVFRAKTPWTVKWDQLQVVSLRFICLTRNYYVTIKHLGGLVQSFIYYRVDCNNGLLLP